MYATNQKLRLGTFHAALHRESLWQRPSPITAGFFPLPRRANLLALQQQ
jgi:hypothetical protein